MSNLKTSRVHCKNCGGTFFEAYSSGAIKSSDELVAMKEGVRIESEHSMAGQKQAHEINKAAGRRTYKQSKHAKH